MIGPQAPAAQQSRILTIAARVCASLIRDVKRDEPFGCSVAPGDHQGFAHGTLLCGRQPDIRGARAPPGPVHWHECPRLRANKEPLLLRGEFDHAPPAPGIAERCEDPASHPEVRMAHVLVLGRFGETEGHAAELTRRHADYFAHCPSRRRTATSCPT